MVGVKDDVDWVTTNRKDLLHIGDAVFEDKNLPVVGDRCHTTGWCETIDVAVKQFKVEEVFKSERKRIWE